MSELELQDAILRHALQLQRLSAHEEAQAAAILDELAEELRQLLASRTLTEAGKREVAALIKSADEAIAARYTAIGASLDTQSLIMIVADRTVETLQTVIPAATRLTAERIASLATSVLIDGAPTAAWWAKQAEDTAFRFAAQVRQGIANGETQERIVQRIVGKRGEPGIMDAARRNVRTLVHSSVMSAANQARLATFRKNSRHIAGVRWLSTLDSHTCLQCAALDGSTWNLEGEPIKGTTLAFQMPPAHWSCRCVASPVPKGLDEFFPGMDAKIAAASMRASKDGPVRNTGFDGFLKRQSPEFIADTLGARRAGLYRAGKLTLRDLVSGTGRPLTLDELSAR